MRTKYVTKDLLSVYNANVDEHDFRILVLDYLAELSRQVRDTETPGVNAEWLRQYKKRQLEALRDVFELVLYDMT